LKSEWDIVISQPYEWSRLLALGTKNKTKSEKIRPKNYLYHPKKMQENKIKNAWKYETLKLMKDSLHSFAQNSFAYSGKSESSDYQNIKFRIHHSTHQTKRISSDFYSSISISISIPTHNNKYKLITYQVSTNRQPLQNSKHYQFQMLQNFKQKLQNHNLIVTS
jgi:transcription termination factor Rho